MSLEQLMALAGQLAQSPRPPGLRPTAPFSSRASLSQAEFEALRDIWSTPLRSQMSQRPHMRHTAELTLPGSTACH
jgi:hypothetical protein